MSSFASILHHFACLGILLNKPSNSISIFSCRQIKMSSPNLNNLIIVGCLLCYSSVIILGLDSSLTSEPAFRYICTVKAWVLMAGFTLSFGSMFSKTWRVHSIFTNVQLNKKVRSWLNFETQSLESQQYGTLMSYTTRKISMHSP